MPRPAFDFSGIPFVSTSGLVGSLGSSIRPSSLAPPPLYQAPLSSRPLDLGFGPMGLPSVTSRYTAPLSSRPYDLGPMGLPSLQSQYDLSTIPQEEPLGVFRRLFMPEPAPTRMGANLLTLGPLQESPYALEPRPLPMVGVTMQPDLRGLQREPVRLRSRIDTGPTAEEMEIVGRRQLPQDLLQPQRPAPPVAARDMRPRAAAFTPENFPLTPAHQRQAPTMQPRPQGGPSQAAWDLAQTFDFSQIPRAPFTPETIKPMPAHARPASDAAQFDPKTGLLRGDTGATLLKAGARGLASGVSSIVGGVGGVFQMAAMADPSGVVGKVGQALTALDLRVQEAVRPSERILVDALEDPSVLKDPEWWAHTAGQTLGSMIGFALPAGGGMALASRLAQNAPQAVARAFQVGGFLLGGTVAESLIEGGLVFNEMKQAGQTDAEAAKAAAKTAAVNVPLIASTGALGYGRQLLKFGGAQRAAQMVVDSLFSGLTEGVQEVGQQLTSNLVQGRPALEGVGTSAIAGLLGGGVLGAGIEAAGRLTVRPPGPPEIQQPESVGGPFAPETISSPFDFGNISQIAPAVRAPTQEPVGQPITPARATPPAVAGIQPLPSVTPTAGVAPTTSIPLADWKAEMRQLGWDDDEIATAIEEAEAYQQDPTVRFNTRAEPPPPDIGRFMRESRVIQQGVDTARQEYEGILQQRIARARAEGRVDFDAETELSRVRSGRYEQGIVRVETPADVSRLLSAPAQAKSTPASVTPITPTAGLTGPSSPFDFGGIPHVETERKYSSTQFTLPETLGARLKAIGKQIPKEDLAEDGREATPHVTVKFGIHTEDPSAIQAILANEPPITVTLGKTSIFPASESGKADVLKVDVAAPALHRLNEKIAAAVQTTDTHPRYQPHATVAYLKPGKGEKYVGDDALKDETFTIDRVTFTTPSGQEIAIPLGGTPPVGAAAAAIAPEPETQPQSGPSVDLSAIEPVDVIRTPPQAQPSFTRNVLEAVRRDYASGLLFGERDLPGLRRRVAAALQLTPQQVADQIDDLSDAIETVFNEHVRRDIAGAPSLAAQMAMAERFEANLPRAHRTLEKTKLQQFSTPLPIAVAAQAAAQITPADRVLEPTAGTGNLLVAMPLGQITALELAPRRAEALRAQGYEVVEGDYLKSSVGEPTVIITNPPWGKYSKGTYGPAIGLGYTPVDVAERFVGKNLRDLAEGGRLVAVMPETMLASTGFKHWLRTNFTPQAVIRAPPGSYITRATDVGSVLLVVDKVKSEGGIAPWPPVIDTANWEAYRTAVEALPPRAEVQHGAAAPEPATGRAPVLARPAPIRRPGGVREPSRPEPAVPGRDVAVGARRPPVVVAEGAGVGRPTLEPSRAPTGVLAEPLGTPPVRVSRAAADAERAAAVSQYFAPSPRRTTLAGLGHPRLVVEARQLAGVDYPALTHQPTASMLTALTQGRVSVEQAEQSLAAIQANLDHQHGYLAADAVGVGKSREAALVILGAMEEARRAGRELRLLVTTKTRDNIADLIDKELYYVASGRTRDGLDLMQPDRPREDPEPLPFQVVLVTDYPQAKKAGDEHQPLPAFPYAIYVVDSFNLSPLRQALVDVGLHGIVGDEAHRYKNVEGAAIGGAWQNLHAQILRNVPREQQFFTYFTATPAQTVEDYAYLYGLRLWPIDGFNDWLQLVTGGADERTAQALAEATERGAINMDGLLKNDGEDVVGGDGTETPRAERPATWGRGGADIFAARLTPAEAEQIPREWKMLGRFSGRDLWRDGTEFVIHTARLDPKHQRRYDQFAELARDIIETAAKWGMYDKSGRASRFGVTGQLQFAAKRVQLQPALEEAVRLAKLATQDGFQPVLSLINVTEMDPEAGNINAAIDKINTRVVDADPDDPEGGFVDQGEIPEAIIDQGRLRDRARDLGKFNDPVAFIEKALGPENVAFIIGGAAKTRIVGVKEFQAGKRAYAVLSAAGSTGISLDHRLLTDILPAKGRRLFIDVQYEWSATEAFQRYGRVDRASQVSAPKILALTFGNASEKKFLATIANRMAALGALSKGGAEATGGAAALEEFEITGQDALRAAREAYEELPEDARRYFAIVKSAFRDPNRETRPDRAGYDPFLPRRSASGVGMKDFQLPLLFMPMEVSNRFWEGFVVRREAIRAEGAASEQRRTEAATGDVLKVTPLKERLTLYEVRNKQGQKFGVLSGIVTPEMPKLRQAFGQGHYDEESGRYEAGLQGQRHYVTFTAGDQVATGLRIPWKKVQAVADLYGAERRAEVLDTPDKVLEALKSGEILNLQVINPDSGKPWQLRYRPSDQRIAIVNARMVDRNQLQRYGATHAPVGNYWFVKDLSTFLERWPLTTRGGVAPTPSASGGTPVYGVVDPMTAGVVTAKRLWEARQQRKAAETAPLVESALPEVEQRWHASQGVAPESIRTKAREALEAVKKMTRHFPEINPSRSLLEATAHEFLLEHERAPRWAQAVAHNRIAEIVDGLAPNEADLLTRALALPDILKDLEDGLYAGAQELPFGYRTRADVETDLAAVQAAVTANPKVQQALAKRQAFVRTLTQNLVDAELLPLDVLEDDRYYHRQVLAYFNAAEQGQPVGATRGRDVRQRERGFQKRRVGGSDFNTRYIEAEFEWVAQALRELKTKDTLEKLKALADRTRDLKALAKQANRERLGENLASEAGLPADAGPELVTQALQPFNQRIAYSMNGVMEALAAGDYQVSDTLRAVAEELGEAYQEHQAIEAERDPEDRIPFRADHPQWWALMSALVQQPSEAGKWAASLFKAIRAREDFMHERLGREFVDPKDHESLERIAPEGYVRWQPEPGNHFFKAQSVDARVLEAIAAGDKDAQAIVQRTVLAMGGPRETWIIPDWLANTLTHFGVQAETPGPLGALDRVWRRALGTWKQQMLLFIGRIIRYNVNNTSGDADAAFAYAPSVFTQVPKASAFLYRAIYAARPSPDIDSRMERLIELGVADTGLTALEIPEIQTLPGFRRLAEADPRSFMLKLLTLGGGIGKYYQFARRITMYRENILRVAAYEALLPRVRAGESIYAASNPAKVDALRQDRSPAGQERLAALLSRDLIGDYQGVSAFTQFMRTRTLPFFSFQEINFKRYVWLFRNALREGRSPTAQAVRMGVAVGAKLGTKLATRALLVNAFMVGVVLLNKLFFPDEEEELRRRGRQQLHLILGRYEDGSIRSVRIEGAFADFLEWVGLQNYPQMADAMFRGDETVADALLEMGKATPNKIVQLWEPFTKQLFEQITRRRTFPDAFRPTPIRDRGEHLAGIAALDRLYARVSGKPVPPGNPIARLVFYRTDPGEAAYYDVRTQVQQWLETHGRERPSMDPTEKSNALYYWKRAIQWDDDEAAQRWRARYRELGGSAKGLAQSVLGSAPLGSLNVRDQLRFRRQLSPDDQAMLQMAEQWYRRVYRSQGVTVH